MRKFTTTPNRGIILPNQQVRPITTVNARSYNRPSTLLGRIDSLRSGRAPDIAITRTQGGIGDVLMTLPTVKAISQKYGCEIVYGTDFDYLEGALPAVLEGIPYIRSVVPYRQIEAEKFDVVLDLTCPCIAHEKPHAPPINRIDLFARHAGIILEDTHIDFVHSQTELAEAHKMLQERHIDIHRNRLVLVQPSSSTTRRDVPLERFKQIVRGLEQTTDFKTLFLVFTHDSDSAPARQTNWENINRAFSMKNFTVRQIAAFMHYCDLVICPDSAILHLAGALDVPTLTFFGPTDPRARVNHYPKAVALWSGMDLKCCPCWFDACHANYTCWNRIEVPLAIQTATAMLNQVDLPNHPELIYFNSSQSSSVEYEVV